MKTLYLLRHAKSCWKDTSLHDSERPLNKRGRKQVGWLAESTAIAHLKAAKIFSSDALRARQTISGLLKQSGVSAGVVYDASLYTFDYLDLVHWLKGRTESKNIVLVGHNPALSGLIDYLAPDHVHAFPTAGWIQISLNIQHWSDISPFCGEVVEYFVPALLDHQEFRKRMLSLDALDAGIIDYPAMLAAYRKPAMIGQDTEFLHQYRVYARKLHGLLKLLSTDNEDQSDTLKMARLHLKELIHLSNPIRDLDVFYQSLKDWQPQLDEDCQRGLLYLMHHVQTDRAAHYQLFNAYVSSDRYHERHDALDRSVAIAEWVDGGDVFVGATHGDAESPLKSLKKKFNKHRVRLRVDSDDADFHHFRLHTKNYLNALLLAPEPDKKQIKQLTRLKKQLGDLQDACVQQRHLLQYATLEPGNDALLLTVEALLHRLRTRKGKLKQAVCEG